ncbi:hypothetical protein QQM39_12315 [Streptomyces sp. DT2A-34]|nr:hypothetical protein [Streptomyces sp. DT2A-34]MDO0911604.1 hypothetical protein [Streptomyces sp. DT2A-34]
MGEEQAALEDEVFPAEGGCGQAVEEPFEDVLVAAGQVAQVVVDAAGGGVTRGVVPSGEHRLWGEVPVVDYAPRTRRSDAHAMGFPRDSSGTFTPVPGSFQGLSAA